MCIRDRDAGALALHAVAPGPRRTGPARDDAAAARLVSALGLGAALGLRRSAERSRLALGQPQVRLPPELRHRHAAPGPRAYARGRPAGGDSRYGSGARGLPGDQRSAPWTYAAPD